VPDLAAAAARYEALGFTLTPRAQHPAFMGTANRLVQFATRSFIELLEVDRPQGVRPHEPDADPPVFSFGAHNAAFLARHGAGLSMIALAAEDATGAGRAFAAAGLDGYAPLHFGRRATLPDGSTVPVEFVLSFATCAALPDTGFFVCENRFPENFWRTEYPLDCHSRPSAIVRFP